MLDYDKDVLLAALLAGAAMAVCMSGAGLLVVGLIRLTRFSKIEIQGEV